MKTNLLPLFVTMLAWNMECLSALANVPPTLSPIPNLVVNEDDGNQTVVLSGIGPGAPSENQTLNIIALSSNPNVIPHPIITYTSPDPTGTLTFRPVADSSGVAVISVIVNDGEASDNTVTRSFLVMVNPVTDPPTLSPIPNQIVDENSSTGPIPFIIGDVDTVASALVVSGYSSNPALIPSSNIVFAGSGNNRTLTVLPIANQFGTATLTVSAVDGTGAATFTSFTVTVKALIRIALAGKDVDLSWAATNGVLQHCSEIGGLWEDLLPEPTSPLKISPSGIHFYRLRER
jgi:hypothetical protein